MLSVTVTVEFVEPTTLGVPEIVAVAPDGLKAKPVGNASTAQFRKTPEPPEAVIVVVKKEFCCPEVGPLCETVGATRVVKDEVELFSVAPPDVASTQ